MISINEQKDIFSQVNLQLHEMTAQFIRDLKKTKLSFYPVTTRDVQNMGFSPQRLYFINQGTVVVENNEKNLFLFEAGDVIFPHCVETYDEAGIDLVVNSDLLAEAVDLPDFCSLLGQDPALVARWMSISQLNQLQMNQIVGSLMPSEERANPGFKRFLAGEVIIQQGDIAEYVYSITSGAAVAVHDGVEVGEIKQDEIFGAIAVLTDQPRTASVIAQKDCMVLMVHRDEFSKMVHSHPTLFLSILKDLAKTITSLNEKVTALSSD